MRLCAAAVFTLVLGGCSTSGVNGSPAAPPAGPPVIYAAIGGSETVGAGATDPLRDAWPQVFYRTALPESTVFYNFGIPGATVADALSRELPEALSTEPTLSTVWLNVNDLLAGVSPAAYEQGLDQLIQALRRGGQAKVLVANTPYLDRLPAYLECRIATPAPGVNCPAGVLPAPSELNADVEAYNAAIARVVQREGAVLVDLHAQGEVAELHPDWVSSDGFHPSAAGYAAIAAQFGSVLKATGLQP
jgi:lysophospholipase L1-like esterase